MLEHMSNHPLLFNESLVEHYSQGSRQILKILRLPEVPHSVCQLEILARLHYFCRMPLECRGNNEVNCLHLRPHQLHQRPQTMSAFEPRFSLNQSVTQRKICHDLLQFPSIKRLILEAAVCHVDNGLQSCKPSRHAGGRQFRRLIKAPCLSA